MYFASGQVSVASPYAVFRATDLGWPPPMTERETARGTSQFRADLATARTPRAKRLVAQRRVIQGDLFAGAAPF